MNIIYKPKEIIAKGRFEIISVIGEGGTGTVYQALDKSSGQNVAIKLLHPDLTDDPKHIEIFKQEALLAVQLYHPHIVTVQGIITDKWQEKTVYLLVMEYLPGGNLTARVRQGISIEQAIKWMKQLLTALAYAHDQGIIHQDIKSANVFVTADNDVKIGDFGLAKLINAAESGVVKHNKGTPAYMSPELCYGEEQDERSDIYSLGVVFFELLTGKLPFEAAGMIELARQHISKPVPSVKCLNSSIPLLLDSIIKRMMAKDKDQRYQSARQILQDMETLH